MTANLDEVYNDMLEHLLGVQQSHSLVPSPLPTPWVKVADAHHLHTIISNAGLYVHGSCSHDMQLALHKK